MEFLDNTDFRKVFQNFLQATVHFTAWKRKLFTASPRLRTLIWAIEREHIIIPGHMYAYCQPTTIAMTFKTHMICLLGWLVFQSLCILTRCHGLVQTTGNNQFQSRVVVWKPHLSKHPVKVEIHIQ